MSDVPFGDAGLPSKYTKRQVGSRNALAEICAMVEDKVEPEIENITDHTKEGISIAANILKGVACGYGGPEREVDEPRLTQLVARLDEYNKSDKSDVEEHEELTAIEEYDVSLRRESPSGSDYAKESICNTMEDIKARNQAAVLDIPLVEYARARRKSPQSWVFIKSQGIKCSADAIEKIASCEMEEKDVDKEVGCLEQFTDSLRRFDYGVLKKQIYFKKEFEK